MTFKSVKAVASRFVVSLAQKHILDHLIGELATYLGETTPEELLTRSIEGKLLENLADEATKKKYMDRLRGAKMVSDKLHNTQFVKQKVEESDFKVFLRGIHEEVVEMAEDGNKKALENFGFIINNPTVLAWLKLNFDSSKQKVIETFS